MHACKTVFSLKQRLEHVVVAEAVGETHIFVIAGNSCNFGEDFVEAAVLAAQHFLNLFVGELRYFCLHPVGESNEHVAGIFTMGLQPCVF